MKYNQTQSQPQSRVPQSLFAVLDWTAVLNDKQN